MSESFSSQSPDSASEALRSMEAERTALQEELAHLRLTVNENKSDGEGKMALRSQIAAVESERDKARAQYQALLGRVGTIKAQLDERLKADEVGLSFRKAGDCR